MIEKMSPKGIIVFAVIAVFAWAFVAHKFNVEQPYDVFVQVALMIMGWYGTHQEGRLASERQFKEGQLANEKQFKVQARERYNRLVALLEDLIEISERIDEAKDENDIEHFRLILSGILNRNVTLARHIKICLHFWNDFAPEAVGDLHKKALTEGDENDSVN